MNIKTITSSGTRYLLRIVRAILGTDPLPPKPNVNHRVQFQRKSTEAEQPDVMGGTNDAAEPVKRRRRHAQTPPLVEVLPLEQRRWLTVKEASARFPCFSEKSLRHLIAQAEAYAKYPKSGLRSNGLDGCFCRPAGLRKILIDAAKFEAWLAVSASGVSSVGSARAHQPVREEA